MKTWLMETWLTRMILLGVRDLTIAFVITLPFTLILFAFYLIYKAIVYGFN